MNGKWNSQKWYEKLFTEFIYRYFQMIFRHPSENLPRIPWGCIERFFQKIHKYVCLLFLQIILRDYFKNYSMNFFKNTSGNCLMSFFIKNYFQSSSRNSGILSKNRFFHWLCLSNFWKNIWRNILNDACRNSWRNNRKYFW